MWRGMMRRRDVLFIADEVITGFGRTGAWLASERFDLDPDLITTAKGLSSGYAPIGAVIASPRVWPSRSGAPVPRRCSGTATPTPRGRARGAGRPACPGPAGR